MLILVENTYILIYFKETLSFFTSNVKNKNKNIYNNAYVHLKEDKIYICSQIFIVTKRLAVCFHHCSECSD